MSEQNYTVHNDLDELGRMVNSLEGYLKSNELYGAIGGSFFIGGNAPSLTVGAIVMRLRRLEVLDERLNSQQRQQLGTIVHQHDGIRRQWTKHYTDKLHREVNSRLDAMSTFFEECADNPGLCPRIYLPEVLRRTVSEECLHALAALGQAAPEADTKRRRIDARLRSLTQPADFVWDAMLAPAYPRDGYWWMYAAPPSPAGA